ncbi:unnamed protein product [Miscanthus lutarioriparius]|uniref:No apical meristem-associated C-terminal domain-containing protein n=1 Tax=Miscanthus lutarioriparius TaxID=422564 RepID=A0A811MQK9_9POAL|nr:unnamed protein product [Miscanthus lutarioriparius]
MSQAQVEGDLMSASHGHGDPNSSELHSFPIFSAASGWEQQQLPSLPWLQSAGVPGLRRGVLPPNALHVDQPLVRHVFRLYVFDFAEKNALKMFKFEDKQDRNFPYLHCLGKLKDKAKWKNRSNQSGTTSRKKQKTTANSSHVAATQLVVTANGEESQQRMPIVDVTYCGRRRRKTNYDNVPKIEALDYMLAKKKEVT